MFLDIEKELFQKILIENCKNLSIIKIGEKEQQPFTDKVDQILSLKKDNPEADTSALEREIDTLVYQLYDLTDEEIAIVENS